MDAAARGLTALNAGKCDEAIKEYTSALSANNSAATYYIKRSTAYQRASKHTEALEDADIATNLAYKRGKRELIKDAQMRRMIALYHLERFADAQFVFGILKKLDEKEKTLPIWEIKIKQKLDALEEGDEKAKLSVKENPDVEAPAQAPSAKLAAVEAPKPADTNTTAKPLAPTPASKIRHDWYQNDENVVVTLLAKGVDKDKTTVEIESNSLSVTFPTIDNSDYNFTLDPLWAEVDPTTSEWRVTPTKITVTLKKRTKHTKWKSLERSEGDPSSVESERSQMTAPKTEQAPAYPTSSKRGVKNWDKLATDLSKSDAKDGGKENPYDDDEEGDEASKFFKQLYKGATPEQQRAMMKSYQESGGTVLSTDWSQVGSKTVVPEPPEGMEAKKYGA